jgi:hypothetical protein
VLCLHLLSLFVGIGAGSILIACLSQLRAARKFEAAVPWGVVAGKVAKLFPIAIAGLVVLSVQGPVIAERTTKRLEAALHANGPGPLGPEARRMTLHPGLWVAEFSSMALVLGVVWVMTEKPGLGGAIAAVLGGYAVGTALALLATRSPNEELAAAPESAG